MSNRWVNLGAMRRMRETFYQALERGDLTGGVTQRDDDGVWVCIRWEDVGPKWVAVAIGTGEDDAAARALADERLADEIARRGDHPRVGHRISKAGL